MNEKLKLKYDLTKKNFEIVKNILIDERNEISDELEPYLDYEDFNIVIQPSIISNRLNKMKDEKEFILSERNIKELRLEIEGVFKEMDQLN